MKSYRYIFTKYCKIFIWESNSWCSAQAILFYTLYFYSANTLMDFQVFKWNFKRFDCMFNDCLPCQSLKFCLVQYCKVLEIPKDKISPYIFVHCHFNPKNVHYCEKMRERNISSRNFFLAVDLSCLLLWYIFERFD